MAGLEADTSSYRQPLPVGPLEMTKNIAQTRSAIQGNISNDISIDKQKLDLMSHQFGIMNNELANLIDSNATKPQAAERLQRISKTLNLPPAATQHMMEELNQAPDVKSFATFAIRRGMDTMQKYGVQLGTTETQQDNANVYQGTRQSAEKGGGFVPATQAPIQYPPETEYNEGGQRKTLGPAGPAGFRPANGASLPVAGPAQAVPAPAARPRPLPVQPPLTPSVSGPTGDTVRRTDMENGAPAGAINRSGGLNIAPPPMFEEGKKMMAADQETATAKATALKPLEEAYDLAKLVKTGPGTENYNKARAYLINAGLISANDKDPTVVYQMLNKNLAQFIDKNGSRSDADLAVKESGNANAKSQVQPALLHMVQKIIGRERIEIARPSSFGSDKYETYGSHKSSFPTNQDERAYAIDKMPTDEARALYKDMRTKALSGNLEAVKFMKSLSTAMKAKVISGINQ